MREIQYGWRNEREKEGKKFFFTEKKEGNLKDWSETRVSYRVKLGDVLFDIHIYT